MKRPKNPDEVLVYEIYKAVAPADKVQEMAEGLKNGKLGYGHVKNMLLEAIIEKTGQEREVYNYYMNHFDEVEKFWRPVQKRPEQSPVGHCNV